MKSLCWIVPLLSLAACSRQAPPEAAEGKAMKNGRIVAMKKAAQVQVGVAVTAASMASLAEYLNVTGTVQPADSRVVHVRPIARGRVQGVLVRVGDRVHRGQALAAFDNLEAGEVISQYQAAQAELRKLKVAAQAAARQRERTSRLSTLGAVPRKDFEAAQADEQAALEAVQAQESLTAGILSRMRRFGAAPERGTMASEIQTPIAGVVIGVAAAPGEVTEAGADLFTIADLSTVWVQAEVYEKDLGRIRTGQQALVQIDTYAGRRFTGKVTYIGDVVDPKTRTVRVRCEVSNSPALLKLDMFATISLPAVTGRRAVAIPESAIQQLNGGTVAFVRKSEETFEVRPVVLGMKVDGLVEVRSGVAAGEMVASEGSFHLKSVLLEGEIAEEE